MAAEVAAGVYFEERRGLVGALHRLLQVLPGMEEGSDVADAVVAFNSGLLLLRSQERSVLLARLIELIAVSVYWPFSAHAPLHVSASVNYSLVSMQVLFHLGFNDHLCLRPCQDASLEPAPQSRLATVVDDMGASVDRRTLVQAERTLLCEVPILALVTNVLGSAACWNAVVI